MRNVIILVLAAVVVWLLIERNRISTELATAAEELSNTQKKSEDLEKRIVALTAPRGSGTPGRPGQPGQPRGSWLDEHIEKGAKALRTDQTDRALK